MGQEENGVLLKKVRKNVGKKRKGKKLPKKYVEDVKGIVNSMNKNDLNIEYELGNDVQITPATNAGLVVPFFTVAQGDGEGSRTGNLVYLRGFNIRYWVTGSTNDIQTTANPKVRVVIFRQKINNTGAFLTTAAALFAGAAAVDIMADQLPAWNVSDQYQVYYDRVHTLQTCGPSGTTEVGGVVTVNTYIAMESDVMQFSHSFGKEGLKVQYNSTTAASQQTNHLYLAFFAQGVTQYCNYYCRTVYEE